MDNDFNAIETLKKLKSKIEIEKLVLDSLKVKGMSEPDYINKFVETMKTAYDFNVSTLQNIIDKMESNKTNKE